MMQQEQPSDQLLTSTASSFDPNKASSNGIQSATEQQRRNKKKKPPNYYQSSEYAAIIKNADDLLKQAEANNNSIKTNTDANTNGDSGQVTGSPSSIQEPDSQHINSKGDTPSSADKQTQLEQTIESANKLTLNETNNDSIIGNGFYKTLSKRAFIYLRRSRTLM
jgi:hypothetical protein